VTDADKIVNHLLETEDPPDYLYTVRDVSPQMAARLDQMEAEHAARFQLPGGGESMSISIGNRHFSKEKGKWTEEIKKRNPAYWNGFNYALLYGNYSPFDGILVRTPRTLSQKNFARAVCQIVDNAMGTHIPNNEKSGVDGVGEAEFNRLIKNPKWPCYAINIDGTWEKLPMT
jgi:hypothetical protein